MNFEYSEAINPYLEEAKFDQAIQFAKSKLAAVPASPFHSVLDKSMLSLADGLCSWIDDFYNAIASNSSIQALYFELTEFDINTEVWSIEGFAYAQDGGLEDPEWLTDIAEDWIATPAFVITGYEELQQAFEEDADDEEEAKDWCEQLVIAQYMQLVYIAHQRARTQNLPWAKISVYYTEHGYDFILRSAGS
ncbi:hypothetical protein MTX78_07945 [Hymenobacter tibetensis]|uniref:DUF5063 domain-containing protein n=1 Tax=Hymenobacter tibetensis TaxID=497967 RepID=A0ABY4D287_9BACT|nr:hypothetical protein [Hymenobacter tibetensis]UOG76520.1 hypothetical protein MTX78_07945 [Hymenobacter tibetensis]